MRSKMYETLCNLLVECRSDDSDKDINPNWDVVREHGTRYVRDERTPALLREILFHSKCGPEGILTLVLIEYLMESVTTCSVEVWCAECNRLRPY